MSLLKEFAAAGPGCACANGLLNCFETTKVKLQLHNTHRRCGAAPIYHTPTMRGVMLQVAQEEGVVRGLLTPGLSASLTRSMLYGAYRVGLYSSIRDRLGGGSGDPTLVHRMISGMLCGGIGSMLSCPLDVVRTRLQADSGVMQNGKYVTGLRRGKPVRYTGMVSALLTIYREEGLRKGLYRGASVTVARASLLNGAQLSSYDMLKRMGWWEEGPALHFTCGLLSGIIAQTVVMPVDTIKSQMMLGRGWRDVAEIIRRNGPFWLYRGWAPACAGQGLIMVLQMPLIEEFRRLLGVKAI
ncbi:hypothetical protein ACHAXT_008889 [Thalassiosira profunda]